MSELIDIISDIKAVLERNAARDDDLWAIADVAAYMKMGTRSTQAVTKHANFPRPIRLPTSENGSQPRWVAGEVKQFCKRFKTQ